MRTWTLVSTSVVRARPAARHPCRDGHAAGQVSSHVRLDDTSLNNPSRTATLRTYLELCRASNLPTVWTNALAAMVLAGAPWQPAPALAAVVALPLISAVGMAPNDGRDVDEDRARHPGARTRRGRMRREPAARVEVQ